MDSRGFKNASDTSPEKKDKLSLAKTSEQVYAELREKHRNDPDLVKKLFSQYETQMNAIKRRAAKFADRVLTKYNALSPKDVIAKARKLQKKYHFTEDEFQVFLNLALTNKTFNDKNGFNTTNTQIARTLGFNPMDINTNKMTVKTEDLPVLQEILKTHQLNSALHQQLIVQSLQYRDCDDIVWRSIFDSRTQDVRNFVHPMVVAMFFPRINLLDEHMLMASISNIVATRHNNQPVRDRPSMELLHDMVSDPNEGVCVGNDDKTSTIAELRNRVNVQVELWKNVFNMRAGKMFPADNNLMSALANCRHNIFDAVDTLLVVDEGSVLRRLLGVFSFRPTIVSVSSVSGVGATFSYPVGQLGVNQVTSIPIINLRIPPPNGVTPLTLAPLSFRAALSQADQYVENKMIVSKVKNVMYSRDVLFFYINRRYQSVDYTRVANTYQFSSLPITTTQFENLNETSIDFDQNLTLQSGDVFSIRAVLSVETADMGIISANTYTPSDPFGPNINGKLITGNSVTISKGDKYIKYNPMVVTKIAPVPTTAASVLQTQPFYEVDAGSSESNATTKMSECGFKETFTNKGIVYMYQKQ